jgi:tRNA A37 threonylcarbamoyladenosine modification protein TsaB
MILLLRTDTATTTIGVGDPGAIVWHEWESGRELSGDLHAKLVERCAHQGILVGQLIGIVVYEGPGSFTGLRIGCAVVNALAYAMGIPIIGSTGDSWADDGLQRLARGEDDKLVMPVYGAEPNITRPVK